MQIKKYYQDNGQICQQQTFSGRHSEAVAVPTAKDKESTKYRDFAVHCISSFAKECTGLVLEGIYKINDSIEDTITLIHTTLGFIQKSEQKAACPFQIDVVIGHGKPGKRKVHPLVQDSKGDGVKSQDDNDGDDDEDDDDDDDEYEQDGKEETEKGNDDEKDSYKYIDYISDIEAKLKEIVYHLLKMLYLLNGENWINYLKV